MTMPDDHSNAWIDRLQSGSEGAVEHLWASYFHRLVWLAQRRVGGTRQQGLNGAEDVALSAIFSLVKGAKAGRYPWLTDQSDLWKLMVTITHRKISRDLARDRAQKRGGGKVVEEQRLCTDSNQAFGMDAFPSEAPSPETLAAIDEQFAALFDVLQDDKLRRVAQLKLEGYSNAEIAEHLECVPRSVQRYLRLIREIWQSEDEDERA